MHSSVSLQVEIAEEGRKKPRLFVVTITYAASVSIQRLLEFIKYHLCLHASPCKRQPRVTVNIEHSYC